MRDDPFSETLKDELSLEEEVVMITRIRYTPTHTIQKFAVSLVYFQMTPPATLVRFDGGQDERVHAHYFFKKPPQKEYHNRHISLETISIYRQRIRDQWRLYLAEFKENYI